MILTRRDAIRLAGAAVVASPLASSCSGESNTSSGGSGSGRLGTLKVATAVPQILAYMGVEEGHKFGTWKGTGLDVELISANAPEVGSILAAGQADLAITAGILAGGNIAKGLDARLVAAVELPWFQYVIASAKSRAPSVADLRGATWGISGFGSNSHYSVLKIAEKLGWSKDDYHITPLGGVKELSAALKSGSIDAFCWSTQVAYNIEYEGFGRLLGSTKDFVGPNVFNAFNVRSDIINDRPNALKAFLEGYFKTVKMLQGDPQKAIDVIVKDWGGKPKPSRKSVKQELPALSTDGHIPPENLQGVIDAIKFRTKGTEVKAGDIYRSWSKL